MQPDLASRSRSAATRSSTPSPFPWDSTAESSAAPDASSRAASWADAPGPDDCPDCGTTARLVQGLLDCPDCAWAGGDAR